MIIEDRYGLEFTTESDIAREQYIVARDVLLSGSGNALQATDAALSSDPNFALAHAARARALRSAAKFTEANEAAMCAVKAASCAHEWEQQHVAITADLTAGRLGPAFAKLKSHMARYPRDALSISSASGVFGMIGFSGRIGREPEQVAFLQPLREHYKNDWWFDSAFAFALGENGAADQSLDLIESSLQANPRSANSAHIYMHVLIESNQADSASQWLQQWLPSYTSDELLYCHLWWHLALFQLHSGQLEQMQETIATHCLPNQSTCPPINVFTDSAAILWRSQLVGAHTEKEIWQHVRSYGDQWFPRPGVFIDVHKAVCLAALEEFTELDAYIETLQTANDNNKLRSGEVVIELARAFGEFAKSEWQACADRIDRVCDQVVRIGGSRAQRRIVAETRDAARARVR